MATLYTQAESNVRKTYVYLLGFILLIVGIGWTLSYLYNEAWLLYFALIFSVTASFYSYWNSDKIVISLTKAKPAKREEYLDLYRITENLAISNGLPMPRLYILNDSQPNAFATGRNPKNGVIAVTTGLLEILDRAELEAVVAHELGHIGNNDILITSVVVVLVGTVVLIADFFFRMTFYGGMRGGRDRGNALVLIGALIFIVLSPILAQLMKFAISRKREYLADSTAALTTRYPEGLARALEKISSNPHQLKVANDATAHLFLVSPFKGKEQKSWFRKLFMTHPPIEERIKKLREIDIQ
jgi:heat shock protein HtpX